ncbi:response regulator [Roseateles sp. DAIF2]|uniref:HD domain-containing phosphohydrolase n=1 Tax=Roseateles sp. DAIF2 TaxID=2714952 RepID=UPI0018A2EDB8|nr:HD domain-containing phosphohydrolase [Roseateles sp. DAIF2]QPF76409.1 response regulator [Roseateles sp. DAIF2]
MPPPAAHGRILVIDDDRPSLQLLDELIRMAGFAPPTLVSDPRELAAICAEREFDLVLIDLDLPHLSGWQVLELLAAQYGEHTPPLLVVSGDARRGNQVRALSAGASDYVTKPFDVGELLLRIRLHTAGHHSRRLLRSQKAELEATVQQRTRALRQSRLDILRMLGRAAEFRDNETGAHILRMSHASAMLARELGWDEEACELMLNASPLHDVGKIAIPDSILLKPGPLTPAERAIMQQHTVKGAAILNAPGAEANELLAMAAEIALHHHERWDGSGYPQGIAGAAIPLAARIVAVTDVLDALTSERPYKQAWPLERALDFIRAHSGSHFDPAVVAALERCLAEVLGLLRRLSDTATP